MTVKVTYKKYFAKKIHVKPASGKAKAVRLTTLNAICRELGCQPGDILEYIPD